MNIPFRNIRQLLSLQAKVAPGKVFITTLRNDGSREELTYAEFNARAHQAANLLHTDFGIQAGDAVAIIDDHPGDVAVLLMACWLLGAVAVPYGILTEEGILNSMRSEPNALCLTSMDDNAWLTRKLREVVDVSRIIQLGAAGSPEGLLPHFRTLVRSQSNTLLTDAPDPTLQSPALRLFDPVSQSSSTLTQGELLRSAQSFANAQAITANQNINHVSSLRSIEQLNMWFATLWAGASTINWAYEDDIFNPTKDWRVIASERIHLYYLRKHLFEACIDGARTNQDIGRPIYGEGIYQQDIKHLRHIISGSHQLKQETVKTFTNLFPFMMLVGYSSNETAGFCTLMPIDLTWPEYRRWMFEHDGLCVGCPLDGCEIAVVDANGSLLKAGEHGELCVRGNVSNQSADSWLHTGETAYYLTDARGRQFVYLINNPSPVSYG